MPSCGATASMRSIPDLLSSPRAQLWSSVKNIDHSEGCLHPHSTCILRTVNINQYYWDAVTWGTVKSFKLLGFLQNIKAGRDVSSWVSEAFPVPLKIKGDMMQNSSIGTSGVGRSSMPMQHSPSTLRASYSEQYCPFMLQEYKKIYIYFNSQDSITQMETKKRSIHYLVHNFWLKRLKKYHWWMFIEVSCLYKM